MGDAYQYVMLMSALPSHKRLFTEKQTPISRLRLERRLSMLSDDHRQMLSEIEQLAQWDYLSHERSDHELVHAARDFIETLPDETLKQLVTHRLELRSIIAALRRRKKGLPAPDLNEAWGIGPWVGVISRNWRDPLFNLAQPFPWIAQAVKLFEQGNSLGLERLLLERHWRELDRQSEGHYFDFVAVVIYLLKWDITARWSQFNGDKADHRFERLLNEGLSDHNHLFPETASSQ
jgi:hypothetical protein